MRGPGTGDGSRPPFFSVAAAQDPAGREPGFLPGPWAYGHPAGVGTKPMVKPLRGAGAVARLVLPLSTLSLLAMAWSEAPQSPGRAGLRSESRSPGAGVTPKRAAGIQAPATQPDPPLSEPAFGHGDVARLAEQLAAAPYAEPDPIGGFWRELDYDGYRDIRVPESQRFWRRDGEELETSGFQMELLHVGSVFNRPVEVHTVRGGVVNPVPFDPARFRYDLTVPEDLEPGSAGYSGARLRWPLNRPEVPDEFLVVQGATYFRVVARGQVYGVSARGLAIRCGDPRGEEFPWFRSLWFERPEIGDRGVTFHALLDSPSIAGAYTFKAFPGDDTTVEVRATLYPRTDLDAFGIAPLTSMFLFDGMNRGRFDDHRDAVHDSHGLQIITGQGQRLWRPLNNPRTLQVASFVDTDPVGFGLVQRRRGFGDYNDLEARYHLRPSAWVEPLGPLGKGSVRLVEIPVDTEFNDNIVAYWQPDEPLRAGESSTWHYRLHFCDQAPDNAPVARVVDSRSGRAPNDKARLFVVDFTAPPAGQTVGGDGVRPAVEVSAGTLRDVRYADLPGTDRVRVVLQFDPGDADVAEFRLQLEWDGTPCSEVWLHRWSR